MSDHDFEDILTYFNNFDSKKNGVLDYSEFARLVSDIGFHVDEKDLKKGFDKIDTDNNDEIDFEEFMAWWGEQR